MKIEEIRKLASGNKLSDEELNDKLFQLKEADARILHCILFVKLNQDVSLLDATEIVINSECWKSEKEGFLKHQQEIWEEIIDANKDKIESIIISEDESRIRIKMK